MLLESGARLGPYEVVALLGAGGMGEVYRARDTRLNRTVALKIVSPAWSNTEEGRQRFEREARAVSQINHPNVCALYDVGRAGDREFLVMEFVEGETLQTRLERGPLPQYDIIRLGQLIAGGLDAAHRQGVVHRDLKPGNIIIAKHGVKVLDFGLARTLSDEQSDAAETRVFNTGASGTVLGTLPYMAPEQLQGGRVDARADVFALGAVLYEMATGRRAFAATSQAGIIAAVLEQQPPPLSSSNAGLSPLLDRLIAQCLAKDPDARPQSAGEVARALALVGESTAAIPVAARASFQRERLIWIALVLLAGLALLVAPRLGSKAPVILSQPLVTFDIPLPPNGQLPPVPDLRNPVAMSPDGRYIAYPLTVGESAQLWLHSLGTKQSRPLRGTDGAIAAFWSPDSRQIAFFTPGSLKRVSIDGDVVAQICQTTTGFLAGSWGADDTIVFADHAASALMRVPAGGGIPQRLPAKVPQTPQWPHLLPDGRHFLVASRFGIQGGALDSEALTQVVDVGSAAVYSRSGHLLYVRDGSLVAHTFDISTGRVMGEPRVISDGVQYFAPTRGAAFAASNTGAIVFRPHDAPPRRLAWIGRDGQESGPIAPDMPWVFAPRLSLDNNHLVVSHQSPTSGATDVWALDLATNTPTWLSRDDRVDNWPTWWPDGRSIVLSRDGDDSPPRLVRKPAAGAAEPAELVPRRQPFGIQYDPDVAPRGDAVAFGEAGDIWLWRVGAADFEPLVRSRFVETRPAFSRDGRWLAYESNQSGRPEVYVQPFDRPGDTVRISNAGGSAPRWRGDGREIFFLDLERQIMAAGLTVGDTVKPATPIRLTKGPPIDSFDVTRDGSRFVVVRSLPNPTPPSLTVILNWETLLK